MDPRDFGAVTDDGADDTGALRATIAAAIAAKSAVCLPSGVLHVIKPPGTGLANVASLIVDGDGLTIYGQGDSSRLSMLGGSAGDWWVLRVSGSNHTLRDFAIDGDERGATTEQTHLVQVWGPASNISLMGLRLSLPPRGDSTGGDCIRAAGEQGVGGAPPTPVTGLTIERVRGISCDRSFVGLQRWVFGVRVLASSSDEVGDQVLDEEPTGFGTIGDVTVRDCRFRRNGLGNGVAMTITGGAEAGYDHTIQSTAIDGSILIYDSARVALRDLTVRSSGLAPTIEARKNSDGLLLDHVYAEHIGEVPAHVISIAHQSGSFPRGVTIAHSRIVQRSPGDLIHGEPVGGLLVTGNTLECLGPTPNAFAAVAARAVGAEVDDVRVLGNALTGNCRYLLRASSTAGFGVRSTIVQGNLTRGATFGVYYENAGPLEVPVIDGNAFRGMPSTSHVVGAPGGYVGSN